ncbi:MAG: hypothetical protein U0Q47_13085 [Mycobacterium sp.]
MVEQQQDSTRTRRTTYTAGPSNGTITTDAASAAGGVLISSSHARCPRPTLTTGAPATPQPAGSAHTQDPTTVSTVATSTACTADAAGLTSIARHRRGVTRHPHPTCTTITTGTAST